jgi:hypothetical protein
MPLSAMNPRVLKTLAVAVALWFLTPLVNATVDEAHDRAMEAAKAYVDQGFTVREDYWNGEVESGQKLLIKHQLFKGNDYAFWLGTASEGCELELAIFDDKGNAVQMEQKKGPYSTSVRVTPQKTGTYMVVFSVKSKKERGVTWALAYGYR